MVSVIHTLLTAACGACLLWACWSDVRHRIIPNEVSLLIVALWVAALAAALLGGGAWERLAWGVVPGLASLGVGYVLFARGVVGGGDVKLFAALALWLGWGRGLDFALYTMLAGGALGVAYLLIDRAAARQRGIPYGLAIAAGCAAVMLA